MTCSDVYEAFLNSMSNYEMRINRYYVFFLDLINRTIIELQPTTETVIFKACEDNETQKKCKKWKKKGKCSKNDIALKCKKTCGEC